MAYNDQNIIVGAASVFVGTRPATLTGVPKAPTVSGATVSSSDTGVTWSHAGFTSEGVEVSYEPDYGEVEVDQLLDSARIFKQGMRVTVNTTFSEATLENLLVIWGQDGADGKGGTLSGSVNIMAGRLGEAPLQRQLFFAGPRPGGVDGARHYHLYKAIQTEASSFALRRAEATTLPASFRCLPVAGAVSGGASYGTITDVTTRGFLDFA